MRYSQYSDYRPATIPYLDSVPSHWSALRLKNTVDGCVNGVWGGEPENDGGDTVVLRVADFDRNKLTVDFSGLTYRRIEPKDKTRRLLTRGDLLLEKSGGGEKTLVGQVVLFDSDIEAVTSNFVAKMTPVSSFSSRYLNYVFSWFYDRRINYCSIKQNTGIQNLDSGQYLNEKFVFPELSEQVAIANFLDRETAKIDTLINKQEQLITLLEEKRQAVISHAVTKGLNPDVRMKHSGVEWLGEVPEHWDVGLVKRYAQVVDCKHLTAEFVDDGIPLASIGEVKGWTVNLSNAKKTTEEFYTSLIEGGRKPVPGDIIYSRNASVGEAALVTSDHPMFAMGQDVCLLRPSNDADSEFILFQLSSAPIASQLDAQMVGATFKRINVDAVRNFTVVIPPDNEQSQIKDYLQATMSRFEGIEMRTQEALTLLRERRSALISAAVTGKIDVRNAV